MGRVTVPDYQTLMAPLLGLLGLLGDGAQHRISMPAESWRSR